MLWGETQNSNTVLCLLCTNYISETLKNVALQREQLLYMNAHCTLSPNSSAEFTADSDK